MDIEKATKMLHSGAYTCVLCRGNEIYTSVERGVKPLLEWLDSGLDLSGFTAADKVVGKAAAFLYVLLGIKVVFAPVMSEGAVELLEENGIDYRCDVVTKSIMNRSGTGICPMEEAVGNTSIPEDALDLIRKRLSELNG